MSAVVREFLVNWSVGGDAAGLRGWLARQGLFVRDCTSFGLPDCIRIGLRPVADCTRLIDALTAWRSGAAPPP